MPGNLFGVLGDPTITTTKEGRTVATSKVYGDAIEKLVELKRKPIEQCQQDAETISDKVKDLGELETALRSLQEITKELYSTDPIKTAMGQVGFFGSKTATASSLQTESPEDHVSINLDGSVKNQSFSIRVDQLATKDRTDLSKNTDITFATDTGWYEDELAWSGSITLNSTPITIDTTMSLQEIVSAINNETINTNVIASLVKTDAEGLKYRMQFESKVYAEPISITNSLDTGALPASVIPKETNNTINDLSALYTYNLDPDGSGGISLSATSNVVSPVPGMTLTLLRADETPPGGTAPVITVTLNADTSTAKSAVETFVERYNDVMAILVKHKDMENTTNERSPEARLYNTPLINTLYRELTLMYSNSKLSLYGISYRENKLQLDATKLDNAIISDIDTVSEAFGFSQTVSNVDLTIIDHKANLNSGIILDSVGNPVTTTIRVDKTNSSTFTVSFTVSGGTFDGKTYTVPSEKITIYDNYIHFNGDDAINTGTPGLLPFKGMTMQFYNTDPIADGGFDSSTLQITQGFTDNINKALERIFTPVTGDLDVQKEAFSEATDKLKRKLTKLSTKAEQDEKKLRAKFAASEAAMTQLQQLRDAATAFSEAMNNRN